MRLPSIKSLIKAHLVDTVADAREVRELLADGRGRALDRANDVMETCGLQSIPWPRNAWSNCQVPTHTLNWFETGDPYAPTLCSIDGGPWFVRCMGDALETANRRWGMGGER